MDMRRRLGAEVFGTFWLVFGGCGSAVLAAGVPDVGIGFLGVSLAFGLTVLTMAYAVGPISGGHFNPAVTIGLVVAKRFDQKDAPAYIGAQLVGAIAAAVLFVIASGVDSFSASDGFASNGFGDQSPGGYSLLACLVAEVVLTCFFLLVILGATAKKAAAGFAPIAIGLALTGPLAEAVGYADWLWVVTGVVLAATLLALTVPAVRTLERQLPARTNDPDVQPTGG